MLTTEVLQNSIPSGETKSQTVQTFARKQCFFTTQEVDCDTINLVTPQRKKIKNRNTAGV